MSGAASARLSRAPPPNTPSYAVPSPPPPPPHTLHPPMHMPPACGLNARSLATRTQPPQSKSRRRALHRGGAQLFSVVWGEGRCSVWVDSMLPEGLLKTRRRSSRCIAPLRVARTSILQGRSGRHLCCFGTYPIFTWRPTSSSPADPSRMPVPLSRCLSHGRSTVAWSWRPA